MWGPVLRNLRYFMKFKFKTNPGNAFAPREIPAAAGLVSPGRRSLLRACILPLGIAFGLLAGCASNRNGRPREADGFYNPVSGSDASGNGGWKSRRDREDFFLPRIPPGE